MATRSASQFDKLFPAVRDRGLRVGLSTAHGSIVRVDLRDRMHDVVAAVSVTDIIDLQTASTELLAVMAAMDREAGS